MPEDLSPPAGRIRIKITCPLSPVTDQIVDSVKLPTPQGPRLILPRHAPLFCALETGIVRLDCANQPPVIYLISRGIAEVRRDICALMAWGIRPDEVHPDKIRRLLADAEAVKTRRPKTSTGNDVQTRIDFYRFVLNFMTRT